MKILLLAQHYAPEEVSGAVLATELASDLVSKGFEVSFITCAPNYPYGKVYAGYRNSFLSKENNQGVTVYRVWSYISSRKNNLARLINWVTFSIAALWGGLAAGRQDIIFSYSPPLPLGISAWLLARLYRARWILRVEDLYPDSAIAAGALRSHFLISILNGFEKFLYHRADHISLISKGFRQNLIKKGVPAEKTSVLPVWVDAEQIYPMEKENAFRRENKLCGKFVILYAGNIGQTSALEDVVKAASQLKDEEHIRFVIVGEGIRKAELIQSVEDQKMENVLFLPYQPREKVAEMMAASDVGVVSLNTTSSSFSFPSKTFTIMASGRPVLAITPMKSEIAGLIQSTACGINIPIGQVDLLVKTILSMYKDPITNELMGRNGRAIMVNNYSRKVCINQIYKLFYKS